jgi:hypothetical protein
MTNDKSPNPLRNWEKGDLSFVIIQLSFVILGKGTEGTVPSFPKFFFERFEQLEFASIFPPYPPPHDEH